jgi:riboflavin kinase/FMN adenylyltransferase
MINWITGVPSEVPEEGRIVSVGGFDGVHLGHRTIVGQMVSMARERNLEVLIASFDPHPKTVLRDEPELRLTTLAERGQILSECGVDDFIALVFDRDMAAMEAEAFVEEVLLNRLGAKVVVVGHDHRFGNGRKGNVALLRSMGKRLSFEVIELPACQIGGDIVSSSRIRTHIVEGEVAEAAALLGRYYSFSGRVVRGAGRGRTIGIPTANLESVDPKKIAPAVGVYAVRVFIPGREKMLPGMMNIGRRPTFDGEGIHLEVNIIDWTGDLYGGEVRVEFVERIRNERKFSGVEELLKQLNLDRERCRALLQEVP